MSIGDFKEMVSAQLAAQRRATPPSPSTAPEVDDLMTYPSPHGTLVRLADVKCRISSATRAALASRPAEVDDEGMPPLPHTTYNGYSDGSEPLYTAEQFRQGQRDAVAADRARRGEGEERFYPQLFLNWNRSQENPPVAIGKEMGVARKAVELSKAAPSHTTNKENG